MTSSIIQALFEKLKFKKVSKKRNDKESMICLTPKLSQKVGVSVLSPSSPIYYAIGVF